MNCQKRTEKGSMTRPRAIRDARFESFPLIRPRMLNTRARGERIQYALAKILFNRKKVPGERLITVIRKKAPRKSADKIAKTSEAAPKWDFLPARRPVGSLSFNMEGL
ncbi:MAG: hypothetical protein HGA28_04085 [Anaerolineaceae bacterium]|nr:hypothetical protein [Anaerolineaceae bacterium]